MTIEKLNHEQYKAMEQNILAELPKLFKAERITEKLLNQIAIDTVKLADAGYVHFPLLNEIVRKKDGLTRNNRMKVIRFFREMIPSSFNDDTMLFGKKLKGEKKIARITKAREEFLKSEMTFWDWCELAGVDEHKPEVKWDQRLLTAIDSAMNEEKGGMSAEQVAMLIADKLTPELLLKVLTEPEQVQEAA